MANFTKIFTSVKFRQLGFNMVEVGVAAAITLGAAVYAYDQMGHNGRGNGGNRQSSVDIRNEVLTMVTNAFKKNNANLEKCADLNALASLSSGTYNTVDAQIVSFSNGGNFSRETLELGSRVCSPSSHCFVRKYYTENEDGQRALATETFISLERAAVTLEGHVVTGCVNEQLVEYGYSPAIKWYIRSYHPSARMGAANETGMIRGNIPHNSKIFDAVGSGGGGSSEFFAHYWLPWYTRYVNFDALNVGKAVTYGYKQYSYQKYVSFGKVRRLETIVYAGVYWTPGCTESQLYAGDTTCRCAIPVYNATEARNYNYTPPEMCKFANPYGRESDYDQTWLNQFRD